MFEVTEVNTTMEKELFLEILGLPADHYLGIVYDYHKNQISYIVLLSLIVQLYQCQ